MKSIAQPDMRKLEERLSQEKFGGKALRWQDLNWERNAVEAVEDAEFWYMRLHGGRIIFSYTKDTSPTTVPHCYDCGTVIQGVLRTIPIWEGQFPCSGRANVDQHY